MVTVRVLVTGDVVTLICAERWPAGMNTLGITWADDGPRAGYFPFYIGCLLTFAGAYVAIQTLLRWPKLAAASFVSRDRLTTMMVTHSMQQAAHLGDRLIMMHRGAVLHDFRGAEKRRIRPDDLLARFESVRRADQLDETAAEMLRRMYA